MWEPAVDLGYPGRRGRERRKEGRKKDPTAKVKFLQEPSPQPVQLSPKDISSLRNPTPSREHKTCACSSLFARKPEPRQREKPKDIVVLAG